MLNLQAFRKTPKVPATAKSTIIRFMVFLAIAYVANGIGDNSTGLAWQPVTWYLKTALGWSADQVSGYMTVLALPWILMPLYPIVVSCVPILGYTDKPYLFGAGILGTGAYLMLACVTSPAAIIVALFCASLSVAFITAVAGKVLVQEGKKHSLNGAFVNTQWTWYWGATAFAGLLGGWLAGHLDPAVSFHVSGFVSALVPLSVAVGCWFLLPQEEKSSINMALMKRSLSALANAFKVPALYLVAAFVFFLNFSPSYGTALSQYYLPEHMHFSQQYIGMLSAIGAGGCVIGGLSYAWLCKRIKPIPLLALSVGLSAVGQCAFVLMSNEVNAAAIFLLNGAFVMVAGVAALALAADACPDGAEGFAYAVLTSVIYLAWQLSDNVGSYLYVNVFAGDMNPLFLTSAALTAVALVFLPFLQGPRD